MPARNTTGNSSPFAMCRVIICTQSSHSFAWPSPDSSAACARNASRGLSSLPSGAKPRALQYGIDLLVQREPRRLGRQALDEREESGERRSGPAAELRAPRARGYYSRFPQRHAARARPLAQRFEALGAEAPRRVIYDALEGGVVAAVADQAQVRERVLDLGALEEAQAAVDLVGNARRDECFLEHARLGVRAVEDRNVPAERAVRNVLADAVGDELRLVTLIEGAIEVDRLAPRTARPEILAEAVRVVGDERVGRIEDRSGRAVVLLELEELRVGIVAAEVLQVFRT